MENKCEAHPLINFLGKMLIISTNKRNFVKISSKTNNK
jgi:hypothetical protein